MSERQRQNAVLAKAAEVIRERGWIQGTYSTTEGCCVVGAMYQAATFLREPEGVLAGAENVLRGEVGHIVSWNDSFETTKERVLSVLDRLSQVDPDVIAA